MLIYLTYLRLAVNINLEPSSSNCLAKDSIPDEAPVIKTVLSL